MLADTIPRSITQVQANRLYEKIDFEQRAANNASTQDEHDGHMHNIREYELDLKLAGRPFAKLY